jgi:hypothetical protein
MENAIPKALLEKQHRIQSGYDPDSLALLKALQGDNIDECSNLNIQGLAFDIARNLQEPDRSALLRVPTGLLKMTQINAFVRGKGGSCVVVVNLGLAVVAEQMIEGMIASVARHNFEPFLESLCASVMACWFNPLEVRWPSFPEAEAEPARSRLISCLIAFVLAHEFGHILLGHHESNSKISGRTPTLSYAHSQDQEFAADRKAVKILQALPGAERGQIIVTSQLFFGLVWTAEVAYEVESATHPPASERWRRVAELWDSDIGSDLGMETLRSEVDAVWSQIKLMCEASRKAMRPLRNRLPR